MVHNCLYSLHIPVYIYRVGMAHLYQFHARDMPPHPGGEHACLSRSTQQNQQKYLCAQGRPRNLGPLATYWVHSEDWSVLPDAQADLSLLWARKSFCWFCHDVAHFKDQGLLVRSSAIQVSRMRLMRLYIVNFLNIRTPKKFVVPR